MISHEGPEHGFLAQPTGLVRQLGLHAAEFQELRLRVMVVPEELLDGCNILFDGRWGCLLLAEVQEVRLTSHRHQRSPPVLG